LIVIGGTVRIVDRAGAGDLVGFVRLEDVGLADAPSSVLGATSILVPALKPEVPFQLMINADLDPHGSYLISVRLQGEDLKDRRRRLFGTTIAHRWRPGVERYGMIIDVRPWN